MGILYTPDAPETTAHIAAGVIFGLLFAPTVWAFAYLLCWSVR